ncbi:MAG: RNA polymerase sigma factor, partial [Mycobacteriales bacterium]
MEVSVGAASVDDPYEAVLSEHWPGLVRLATLLLRDAAQAEDVVQDAVVSCLRRRPDDPDAALAYLRRAVVNTAHSALRRRMVALRHRPAAA